MNSMAKVLLLALPVLSATAAATAAGGELCEPKAYEMALRYQQKSAEIVALQLYKMGHLERLGKTGKTRLNSGREGVS